MKYKGQTNLILSSSAIFSNLDFLEASISAHRLPISFAMSVIPSSGFAIFILGLSSLLKKKNADIAPLGAFGSLTFFLDFSLPPFPLLLL